MRYSRIFLIMLLLLLFLLVAGCGTAHDLSTPEGAAKVYVEAMIKGDSELMGKVNRSGPLDFPTHYLMSDFAPDYAGRELSEFTFELDSEDSGKVLIISEDGQSHIRVKRIGDSYYFVGFK